MGSPLTSNQSGDFQTSNFWCKTKLLSRASTESVPCNLTGVSPTNHAIYLRSFTNIANYSRLKLNKTFVPTQNRFSLNQIYLFQSTVECIAKLDNYATATAQDIFKTFQNYHSILQNLEDEAYVDLKQRTLATLEELHNVQNTIDVSGSLIAVSI